MGFVLILVLGLSAILFLIFKICQRFKHIIEPVTIPPYNKQTENISAQAVSQDEYMVVSGFWRRLLAFIIDIILVCIISTFISSFLCDVFARLGGWGRLIGFCLALPYFTFFNSSIGKGQTIGKEIVKIAVVNQKGEYISITRSLLRYTILGLPFFLNGAIIPYMPSLLGCIIATIDIFFILAIIYLYVFNRRTRQSLHDLIVGTYVVKTIPKGTVDTTQVWKPHLAIVAVIGIVTAFVVFFVGFHILKMDKLLVICQSIHKSGYVNSVNFSSNLSMNNIKNRTIFLQENQDGEDSYFEVNVTMKKQPTDYAEAANKIAAIILKEHPEVMTKKYLKIGISDGFDIGLSSGYPSIPPSDGYVINFFSGQRSMNFKGSPKQWQSEIRKSE